MVKYFDKFVRYFDGLSKWEWFALMACVVVIGLVCLKGFGSRKNY